MRTRLVLTVALSVTLLAGCEGSDSDAQDAKPNPLLLTAQDIGGPAKAADLQSADTARPTQCGPDSDVIRDGSEPGNFRAFSHGGTRVVVGAWDHLGDTEVWLEDTRTKADDPTCTNGAFTEPSSVRWIVTRIQTPGTDEAAFTWTRWETDDEKTAAPKSPTSGNGVTAQSGARGYRQVGRFVVSVTISNSTTTPPDAAELDSLLDEQASKVEASQ